MISTKYPLKLLLDREDWRYIFLVPHVMQNWYKVVLDVAINTLKTKCEAIELLRKVKFENGLVKNSKSPQSTPTFCVQN